VLRLVVNPTYMLISLGQGMDAFIISGLSGIPLSSVLKGLSNQI
jgi:hypothetical protein